MTPTERLYFDDPFLAHFTGRVLAHGTWSGAPSVVLDRTAFYPEAGGQMADRGVLGGHAVRDVQVDDAGVVHHLLELSEGASLPAPGTEVSGDLDRAAAASTWRCTPASTCSPARWWRWPGRTPCPRGWGRRCAPSTWTWTCSTSGASPRPRPGSTPSSTTTCPSAPSSPRPRSSPPSPYAAPPR
ncbi:alanine--tRNA ligase-related protein [Cystobacter fuscus]